MAHLPSKPSRLACVAAAPVAVGVLVGGVRRVDGVDARGAGGGEHLHPGEVPEVAGVLADGIEVAVDAGPQRGRQVAGAEDDRLEPVAGPRDLGRVRPAPRPPR